MEDLGGGTVVVTDPSNADGSMSRQCALEAVQIYTPTHAGIFVQTADGWTEWNVERGRWQDALAANFTFCLALHQALLETRRRDKKGNWRTEGACLRR